MIFLVLSFETETEKDKFELIYNRYKKLLLYKAYNILRDYELAQDAVSEAFIRVYRNLRKLDDPKSGKTAAYLVMIVRNVSITLLNKQKKAGVKDSRDEYDFEKADSYDLEQAVVSENSASGLLKVVGQLKDELKTPFLLKYAYDMSNKEIAALLNITESNAAVRIHRARAKLTEMLREGGYGYEI
ncbi:MAG: sigma-70 family RNA polymerase sigma factor [Defluviitaleaceae bacterium]|nr:sigma-70 family RNA polymerase sigma factor [Defluviitaleaceae bacterium]